MKKSRRILAALLTAVLFLPACAQNDDDQGAQDTTAAAADPSVTTEAETTLDPNLRANHFDNLPADINFNGGTVTVLAAACGNADAAGKIALTEIPANEHDADVTGRIIACRACRDLRVGRLAVSTHGTLRL